MKKLIETAKEKLNDAMDEARAFCEDIASRITDYMSERSDNWIESDNGQMYQSFCEAYELVELDPIEVEQPEHLDTADIDEDVLHNLPIAYDEV